MCIPVSQASNVATNYSQFLFGKRANILQSVHGWLAEVPGLTEWYRMSNIDLVSIREENATQSECSPLKQLVQPKLKKSLWPI